MLHFAEVFDSLRIVPRLVLFAYGYYVYHVTNMVLLWYFAQPSAERNVGDSGMIGLIITAVTGFAPWIYRIYADTSRNWSAQPQSSITTTATQTTMGPTS